MCILVIIMLLQPVSYFRSPVGFHRVVLDRGRIENQISQPAPGSACVAETLAHSVGPVQIIINELNYYTSVVQGVHCKHQHPHPPLRESQHNITFCRKEIWPKGTFCSNLPPCTLDLQIHYNYPSMDNNNIIITTFSIEVGKVINSSSWQRNWVDQ